MLLGSLANVWLVSALHLFSESSERGPMQTLGKFGPGLSRRDAHVRREREPDNATTARLRETTSAELLALRSNTPANPTVLLIARKHACDRAYVRPQPRWTTWVGARFDRAEIARECREVVDRLRAETQRYSGLSTPDWRAMQSRAMVNGCRCPHLWS